MTLDPTAFLEGVTLDDFVRRASELSASEDEDAAWAPRAAEGDPEARDRLILAHLRDVVDEAIARRGGGASVDSLIRRGLVGLVRAAETYPASGAGAFSSFARALIRREIRAGALHH